MKLSQKLRVPIGFVVGLIYLIIAGPSWRSIIIGSIVMMLGESIRFISAGTLIKFKGVTRSGIYAYSRNPLYLGSFIIGCGACIMGSNIWFAAFFLIAYPLMYMTVIKHEETWLRQHYGENYIRYFNEVPRFMSLHFNIARVLADTSFHQAAHNKELKTVLGVLGVILFMAVKLLLS